MMVGQSKQKDASTWLTTHIFSLNFELKQSETINLNKIGLQLKVLKFDTKIIVK